jgi:hypothetical protein
MVGAVATPLALVVAVAVGEPAKLALGPVLGAVKVTVTLGTGLPPESFTVASSPTAKLAVMAALWGEPAMAVMVAGGPTVLERVKLAEVADPEEAVTA